MFNLRKLVKYNKILHLKVMFYIYKIIESVLEEYLRI